MTELILERRYLIPPLLRGDYAMLRPPFRVLDSPTVITDLGGKKRRPKPFVPWIGSVQSAIPTAILPHRAISWNYWDLEVEIDDTNWLEEGYRSAHSGECFGDDQRNWHIPLRIVAHRRHIRVEVETPQRSCVQLKSVRPRLFIRLLPYGVLTLSLTFHMSSSYDLPNLIRSAIALSGYRRQNGRVRYYMSHRFFGEPTDFLDGIAQHIENVLFGTRPHAISAVDNLLTISTHIEGLAPDSTEALGLLMLNPDYRSLKSDAEWHSLFGRYLGDVVLAGSGVLLLNFPSRKVNVTDWWRPSDGKIEIRPPSKVLRWNLIYIMELARIQKILHRLLLKPQGVSSMSEESVKRLSELCQLLSVVHWGMQSHHRRWYYTCRDLLRISASQTRIDKLIAQRRSAERETELLKKMELLMDQESVEIHVSGGQIGSINLGTVLGNIDNNLTMVESAGQGEVAKALREIANAIRDDTHLDDEQKRELLQDVEVLSEAAQEPDEQRQKGVLKAVFEALKSGLSIAVDAGKVWTMWAPLAAKFFGL